MPIKLPPHFNFFFFPCRAFVLCTSVLSLLLAVPPSAVLFVFFALFVCWLGFRCQTPILQLVAALLHSCAGETKGYDYRTVPISIVWPFLFLHRPLCRLQSPYRHASTRPGGRRVKCQQIPSRRTTQTDLTCICVDTLALSILCNLCPSASIVAEGRREPVKTFLPRRGLRAYNCPRIKTGIDSRLKDG